MELHQSKVTGPHPKRRLISVDLASVEHASEHNGMIRVIVPDVAMERTVYTLVVKRSELESFLARTLPGPSAKELAEEKRRQGYIALGMDPD